MSQQYPGPGGHPGAPQAPGSQVQRPAGAPQGPADGQWEDGQWEDGQWEDGQWEDGQWEEDQWDENDGARPGSPPSPPPWAAPPGGPWPPPPPPPPPGGRGGPARSHIQPVTAGVIAVIAALAVAVVVLFTVHGHSTAPSSATGNAPVGGGAPAQGGGGAPAQGGGGGGSHLFLGGQVIKVSSTSITLSAQGRGITAAITSSTQFTGTVKSASGIKPGQQVMVVISGYGSAHPVAQSISDPPSMP